ncbi:transposase [Robbsia andropogonis]|uniref:transposase n=1 Tax=Robbsia andropogonis TaxID=28092 RepID=UPI003D20FFDE
MHTISKNAALGRVRRTYSASFKAELIAQCQQVGVSCSAVAISHGMNPNVLRRWIKDASDHGTTCARSPLPVDIEVKPTFISLPMDTPTPSALDTAPVCVRIDIERNGASVSVSWPLSRLNDSAAWLREVLQ